MEIEKWRDNSEICNKITILKIGICPIYFGNIKNIKIIEKMKDIIENRKIAALGSIKKIFYTPVDFIISEPDIINHYLKEDYEFLDSYEVAVFDKDSAKLEIQTPDKENNLYRFSLEASLSHDSEDIDIIFQKMKQQKFVVFALDANNVIRVLGRKLQGAKFDFSFNTKNKIKNIAQYDYSFSWESPCIAPFSLQEFQKC